MCFRLPFRSAVDSVEPLQIVLVAKDGDHPHEDLDDDEIKEEKRSSHSSYRLLTQLPPTTPTGYGQLILDLTKYNPSERLDLTVARLELEDLYDDDDCE